MRHLNAQSLGKLLAGDAGEAAWFREHLATECEECERFLAESPELDGQTDQLLLALSPRPAGPALDEVGFRRIWRRLRAPRLSRIAGAAGAAVALAAGLAVVFALPSRPAPDDALAGITGLKGAPTISVELLAAVQRPDGSVERAEAGHPIDPTGTLLLRYHATEAGTGLVFRGPADRPELLGSFPLQPGTHDLRSGATLVGLPLADEPERLQLWLVAGAGPTTPSTEEATRALLAPGAARLAVTGLSLELSTPGTD